MSFRTVDLMVFIATLSIAFGIGSQFSPAYTLLIMSLLMLSMVPFISPIKRRFYVYGSIAGVMLLPALSYLVFDLVFDPPIRSPKEPPVSVELAFEDIVSYLVAGGLVFGGWIGFVLGAIQQQYEASPQTPT